MIARAQVAAFEETTRPHLPAAWNLARWLLRDDHEAEDALQDACVRALRFFGGFNGTNARAWLLAIVRNTCYSRLQQRRTGDQSPAEGGSDAPSEGPAPPDGPEVVLLRAETGRLLEDALARLPIEYREAFVLREMEGLTYREIADVAGIPIGTVMSRLSRARAELQRALGPHLRREARA